MAIFYADTAPYTANYIKLEASKSGAVLTVKVTFQDDAADTGNPTYPTGGDPASLDKVNGTLTVSMDAYQPSTSNLTATWGTPTWATTDAL
jgi:2-methylaconitate cis-trans-isomerase PrpF